MGKGKDLTGKLFGRWLVIKKAEDRIISNHKRQFYLCECQCENKIKKEVSKATLLNGKSKSCGCLQKEAIKEIGKAKKKYNKYDLSGEFGIGYTTNTNVPFYFDLEDYDNIKNYAWYENKGEWYSYIINKSPKYIALHRLIMNAQKNDYVDHRNHDTFDNRKYNLRKCTNQQNGFNNKLSKNNTSGYTGVTWNKRDCVWNAVIKVNYKTIYLGSYSNKHDAIKVRKQAEIKYFGDYRYEGSENNKI